MASAGRSTLRGERGHVAGFVVIMTVALVFAAGLVLDGGTILTARRQALNEAEQAARAGSQGLAIEALREGSAGTAVADPDRARQQVADYLGRLGRTDYSVTVSGDSVTVTVRIQRDLHILPGGPKTMSGTSTARSVGGVSGPET